MTESPAVSIVCDPSDGVVAAPVVRWAVDQLRERLAARGATVQMHERLEHAGAADWCVLVGSRATTSVQAIVDGASVFLSDEPEALGLVPGSVGGRAVLLATGSDVRGVTYAVLELADRTAHAADVRGALSLEQPLVARPANRIRSVTRLFSSDVEDKEWFHSRSFWPPYLSMLASQRFNRFSLTLGLTYNFPRHVEETYFYFPYPFLLDVPGYAVRVPQLSDTERDRNLASLKHIGRETVARGLEFHVGLWTHAYEWIDSPSANYTVEGLTPQTHASYCRDALHALLEECPEISGVTFRAHVESGIPHGSYDFWRTVFDGIVRTGRRIEINIHSKGIEHELIDIAVATGLPVVISPKYTAEHQGLPYHQAAIRELELSTRTPEGRPSTIPRRFTRYGYADYLAEDRPYEVMFRLFPGTQRVLLWGDPELAAGFGRFAGFGGSLGLEVMEPLTFKGRRGSGLPGGRDGYEDQTLRAGGEDWEKHRYTYRLLGRLLYDPEALPEGWRRARRDELGLDSDAAEAALATASRILLLVTSAYLPSADDNKYWPELYTNMPICWGDSGEASPPPSPHPYSDALVPKRFGNASPLDPMLFATTEEAVDEALRGELSGRYAPLDVADWLDGLASAAAQHLATACGETGGVGSAAFRRLGADVSILSGLGHFFAHKLRAAVSYTLYRRTGAVSELARALESYRGARAAWADAAECARGVYRHDQSYGEPAYLRGHWLDRLPAIDHDIGQMETELRCAPGGTPADRTEAAQAAAHLMSPDRSARSASWGACAHTPPLSFRPSEPLVIRLRLGGPGLGDVLVSVRLHYRGVNQAESYRVVEMVRRGDGDYGATVPGEYTDSPFPLQYFFSVHDSRGGALMYPGLDAGLSSQPYFMVGQK